MAEMDLTAIATNYHAARMQNSIGIAAMRMMRDSEQQVVNLLDASAQNGASALPAAAPQPASPPPVASGDRGLQLDIMA
jgi:hypothetical protein